MFPYPSGGRPARRPPRGLHRHRHRLPLQADARVQRPAPDGLGRLRPARRAVRRSRPNTHPRITTQENIDNFRRQIKSLGFSYDWDREVDTTDPDYYKWTQWIFLQIYDTWYDPDFEWTDAQGRPRKGKGRPIAELPIPPGTADPDAYRDSRRLAYRAEVPVNWCPELGTVLANEEVIDGKSERGGHPVVRMPLKQWMLRITAYAERLVDDLELARLAPRHQGHAAQLGRPQRGGRGRFPHRRRTSRPGWPIGRIGLARDARPGRDPRLHDPPRHALRRDLHGARPRAPAGRSADDPRAARRPSPPIAQAAARKSDLDRTDLAKTKTGVFTGGYAINPVNGQSIPIWIADYVLMGYGTGAIMAVPGHDERDFEFATDVRPADRPRRRAERSTEADAPLDQRRGRARASRSTRGTTTITPRRPADRRGEGRHHRLARAKRARQEDGQLQAPRLAVLAPALLGRAVPGRARRARPRPRRCPSRSCPSCCPSWTTSSPPASPSRR